MPRISFTPNLQRHVACPPATVAGATVREALDHVFADHPRLAGYLLDDEGRLRKHMVVFVDGSPARDRDGLTDPVGASSEILVMQALSGG